MEYLLFSALIAILAVAALMLLTGRISQIVQTIGITR